MIWSAKKPRRIPPLSANFLINRKAKSAVLPVSILLHMLARGLSTATEFGHQRRFFKMELVRMNCFRRRRTKQREAYNEAVFEGRNEIPACRAQCPEPSVDALLAAGRYEQVVRLWLKRGGEQNNVRS